MRFARVLGIRRIRSTYLFHLVVCERLDRCLSAPWRLQPLCRIARNPSRIHTETKKSSEFLDASPRGGIAMRPISTKLPKQLHGDLGDEADATFDRECQQSTK